MTKAGALPRPIQFGISVVPLAADHAAIVEQAVAADELGFDLVGIQDHPYQRRFLDTFALIGDLLARTTRIRFFPDVANLPLRPPAMLAKQAASLDLMSGGRFELAIGPGGFWDHVAGMGGPRRSLDERIGALEEALPILRAALDAEPTVAAPGPVYPLPGYKPGPPPAHRVGIWVGAIHPRSLEIIGRLADGWVPSVGRLDVERLAAASAQIDAAARAAGRDPAEILRVVNVGGTLRGTSAGNEDRSSRAAFGVGEALDGPVELWVETLTGWARAIGVDAFVIWPSDMGQATLERIAQEVAPAVRAAASRRLAPGTR